MTRFHGLIANGNMHVLIHMIQPTDHHVLSHNHVVTYGNRSDNDVAGTHQRSRADFYRAHAIVNNAEVFDRRVITNYHLVEREYVPTHRTSYLHAPSFLVEKGVKKYQHPTSWSGFAFGYQQPVDHFF